MTPPLLSVVLPCRNQADHIVGVIERYLPALERLRHAFEIVAVPNACTDSTPERVADLARREPRVRVVENPAGGWGASVLCGLEAAAGHILCYANSARTEPDDLVRLFELYLRSGPCLAKVRRVKRRAFRRELGSWLYNVEGRVLFGIRAWDINGTPKILSRDLYRQLHPSSPGDLLDLEILARAADAGIPIVEMDVVGFRRHGGRSSTNLASALGMYVGALRLRGELGRRPASRSSEGFP